MFQIVQTTRTTYLCESLKEEDGKAILTNAFNSPFESYDPENLARLYVKAKIKGHLRPIRVSLNNVESIQEGSEELDAQIKIYLAQIPLVKKRAEADMILEKMGENWED